MPLWVSVLCMLASMHISIVVGTAIKLRSHMTLLRFLKLFIQLPFLVIIFYVVASYKSFEDATKKSDKRTLLRELKIFFKAHFLCLDYLPALAGIAGYWLIIKKKRTGATWSTMIDDLLRMEV
jgi:ABC-type dipeptide/oligopeptide/nickel transport system permease subunit